VSERAIERANKQASERLASERASVVITVVGAAAATVAVRRPERVSKRAIERANKQASERLASERASVVVSVVGAAAAAVADAHRHTATGAASCTAPFARRAPLTSSRAP